MPLVTRFRYFVEEDGTSDVRSEHDSGSRQLRSKFLSRIGNLAKLPIAEWHDGLVKPLHGECAGLLEIRFFADHVQQRPLGFRSGESEFIILFWARERGGKWVPRSACARAQRRKIAASANRGRSRDLWIALE
jgi:hypothetical protein